MKKDDFDNINDPDYVKIVDKKLEKMLSNGDKEIEKQIFEADLGPLGSFKLEFAKDAIAIPEAIREDFVMSAMGALMQSLAHPQLASAHLSMLLQLDYLSNLLTQQEFKDN